MADSVIARLVAEITGDTSGLKSSVREAEGEFGKVEAKAKKAGKAAGSSFEKAGAKIEESTAGVRKFSGAISSAVGVVTALVGVVTLLTAGVRSALSSQEAFIKSSDAASDSLENQVAKARQVESGYNDLERQQIAVAKEAKTAADTINEGLEDQIGLLSTLASDTKNFPATSGLLKFFGIKDNEELIAQAESAIRKINNAAEQTAIDAERAARAAAEATLEAQTEAIRLSFLDEKERIREIAKARKEQTKAAAIDAGLEADSAVLAASLASIDKRAEADVAAIMDAERIKKESDKRVIEERKKQEQAAARETAKAYADAIRSELQGATDDIFGSSGGFTTRLDTLVQELRRVRSDVQGLKQ